jgi:hypothetical protein
MTDKTSCDFKIIQGGNNVILVAPHGYSGDDDNTAQLARLIQEKLGCYAVINETYRKPRGEKGEQGYNANKKICILYKNNFGTFGNILFGVLYTSRAFSSTKHNKISVSKDFLFVIMHIAIMSI